MEEQNPMKRYTVGALWIQTIVLLGLAAFSASSSDTWSLPGMSSLLASLYLGALGVVAFWLTLKHDNKTVRRRTLQMWVVICILLSLLPLYASLSLYILYPHIQNLASFFSATIFLIPTILVLVFSSMESP
jgi:hypothetical protein